MRHDGIHGAATYYSYELPSGCRRRVHCPAPATARIRTFGDSFTHCDQVSDGETWQEVLSAHLNEGLENYGVGGYSVFQAYLRMQQVEREAAEPADYLILNIWDDDHLRNLDPWPALRRRTLCVQYTQPHLDVELTEGLRSTAATVTPRPNPLRSAAAVRGCLSDPAWLVETLGDAPLVRMLVDCGLTELSAFRVRALLFACYAQLTDDDSDDSDPSSQSSLKEIVAEIDAATAGDDTVAQGESAEEGAAWRRYVAAPPGGAEAVRAMAAHVAAALAGSRFVVEQAEEMAARNGQKLMVLLSHSEQGIRRELRGEPRWDARFVRWLRGRPLPLVDLRDAHREVRGQPRATGPAARATAGCRLMVCGAQDYAQLGCSEDAYLARH